jgi:prepilin-type N-terminal cleavage/methylation domain-containing protein
MNRSIQDSGFTLLEVAMVLFILSLMLSAILPSLATRLEQGERANTQSQLDEIEEVLYGFAIRNGRLPCPDCPDTTAPCIATDVDDGNEDRTAGECKTEVGNLPWVTLGVQESDEWNQYFTYRVSEDFADDTDGTGCAPTNTQNVSFSLCSNGDITVLDSDGGTNVVATLVPAIVVSHGNNWTETPTVHEAENYDDGSAGDTDKTFVNKDYSQDATEGFDDLLFWISPHVLGNRMLQAGALP